MESFSEMLTGAFLETYRIRNKAKEACAIKQKKFAGFAPTI